MADGEVVIVPSNALEAYCWQLLARVAELRTALARTEGVAREAAAFVRDWDAGDPQAVNVAALRDAVDAWIEAEEGDDT